MKHIQLFENFNSLTAKQRAYLDDVTSGATSYINGVIDVDGNVKLTKGFMGLKFGKVTGNFDCSLCALTSLKGSPEIVNGAFNCSNNKLTNLEGSPKRVGGNFYCLFNIIPSLEGSPDYIGADFYCTNRDGLRITSLKGLNVVKGDLAINANDDDKYLDKIYGEMQKGPSWELALAICKPNIPKDKWEEITDKPSDKELEKLLHDIRGKIQTKKFGI